MGDWFGELDAGIESQLRDQYTIPDDFERLEPIGNFGIGRNDSRKNAITHDQQVLPSDILQHERVYGRKSIQNQKLSVQNSKHKRLYQKMESDFN